MQADLIITIVGLLLLLIALVFVYVWLGKTPKKPAEKIVKQSENFETLSSIIADANSTKEQLIYAVEKIAHNYNKISKKDEAKYLKLILHICVHPQTESRLVLLLERTLRENNPKYEKEIERALSSGLAAR